MAKFIGTKDFARLLEGRPEIVDAMAEDNGRYQIARAIIAERTRRGWSQGVLARKARLTQPKYQGWKGHGWETLKLY